MEVIDDFISPSDHEQLEKWALGTSVRWKYNRFKVYKGDDQPQFTHRCFEPQRFPIAIEPSMKRLDPILYKLTLDPFYLDLLVRIKLNLTLATPEIITTPYHTDTCLFNKTAIYYINSNNGYTIFEDGTKVGSKANRIVIFDAQTEHAGTTHTDEDIQSRCVVNINYFPKAFFKDEDYS